MQKKMRTHTLARLRADARTLTAVSQYLVVLTHPDESTGPAVSGHEIGELNFLKKMCFLSR